VDDEADDEDDDLYTKSRKGTSSRNGLNSSVSSTMSNLTQAERMANKVFGVKATPNRVKSVQAAEAAAKKEREEKERRAKMREQLERKKAEDKKRREEEERAKEEEERAKRRADEEERRRKLAHQDKIRRLKMEKAEQQKKQREAEEQKAAEEEAAALAAKRKAAAAASTLNRSQSSSNLTKATASSLNKAASGTKTPAGIKRLAPTPSKVTQVTQPLNISKTTNTKAGPSGFRVEEASASASTIKSVNRPTLGPPSRASGMGQSSAAGPSRPSTVRTHAATALQQQRATLQAQLDQKALEEESENIVLPDINSEYSDSDDSDRETDFKRPAWAESPELKQALENQASVNPDELFGPIRPLSMEELFNARVGKFRARTSSANWSGADRLTEAEEREYARRMGFKPINAPRDGGQ
jgi:hypothetical protein